MVDTKAKKTPTKGVEKAPAKSADGKPKAAHHKKDGRKGMNAQLSSGVYRFSHPSMYHKKALWKFMGKKTTKTVKPQKPKFVVKPIGGDKNGGTRTVVLQKRPSNYPTMDKIRKRRTRKVFSEHTRYVRPTLTPGTICILLAGRHKGKRVVLLKTLKSGLLLVNGPFKVNACPLRRVHQNYVIATSTKIDISSVKVPEKLNDKYFRRLRQKRAKKEEGEIFAKKEEKYAPSEERKKDQEEVDKQLIEVLKKHPEKRNMFAYLKSMFGLKTSQYPHRMKF